MLLQGFPNVYSHSESTRYRFRSCAEIKLDHTEQIPKSWRATSARSDQNQMFSQDVAAPVVLIFVWFVPLRLGVS